MQNFPKRTIQNQIGSSGQSYIQFFIENSLKWVYHPINQNNDFGIDGYIEVIDNDCATGKLIALQIKHGNSYFKHKNISSYTYFGDDKHLNYYLNNRCPVILIILDESFGKKYWQLFDLSLTSPEQNGWSIEIPEKNVLDGYVLDMWKQFAGPIRDYKEEISHAWEIDKQFSEGDLFMFPVTMAEVYSCSYDYFLSFIKQLSKNEKMLLRMHSTIELYFPDYQKDERELFEIPEVIKWFVNAIAKDIPLAYFLSFSIKSYSFFMVSYSLNTKVVKNISKKPEKILIEYSNEAFDNVLSTLWENLNTFCDEHPAAEILNKEISAGILNVLRYLFHLENVISEMT